MRILILHSRYLSGDASGENRVVEDEARLLRDGGHDVVVWQPSPSHISGLATAKTAANAVWSRGAVAHVRRLVSEQRPQIVHVHNLFPTLSPAVLPEAHRGGAAVVMSLHNYRIMCPPSTFLREGRVCEDCLGRFAWPSIVHGCYRGSALGSATIATSVALHRTFRSYERTSLFLAVSSFVRDKHIEGGIPPRKIRVKSNFAWETPQRVGPGQYFLYLGRLSAEKGVDTLLDAWGEIPGNLWIAGDGPQGAQLRGRASDDVRFLGAIPAGEVPELVRHARALVLPSRWYETQPRVILEAFAAGVPVIASRIGGLPDLINDGVTGLLVSPGDLEEWQRALITLSNDDRSVSLGETALRAWNERYRPDVALMDLEDAYEVAIQMRG